MKSKSREQIIAEQESIGNVKISKEEFNNLNFNECFYIPLGFTGALYFAPRDVVYPDEKIGCGDEFYDEEENWIICGRNNYQDSANIDLCPSCQKKKEERDDYKYLCPSCREKKKDNQTRQQDVRKNDLGETNPHLDLSAEHIPADDIHNQDCLGNENVSENKGSDIHSNILPDCNIQQSKIFENDIKLIDKRVNYIKTIKPNSVKVYHKELLENCIFELEEIKKGFLKIKEKWGKI